MKKKKEEATRVPLVEKKDRREEEGLNLKPSVVSFSQVSSLFFFLLLVL